MEVKTRKKLIEVALPLDAINAASAREKSIRHGHPSTLHLWWARRPLAAARAVLFAQMVDDPSACPELFSSEEAQAKERQRLFRILEELVMWENTTNEQVIQAAREEIGKSWQRACEDNQDHQDASSLFDPEKLPAFHDPFSGGGTIPLEAQRLGLEAHASDLNPVAVLIGKAIIEIPPLFAGKPPVNGETRSGKGSIDAAWRGTEGLAEDIRYYGKWMSNKAEELIGHLYPKVQVTSDMVLERPDLQRYEGRKLKVIAWLWARTVKSPDPACAEVYVPLASTFLLSSKRGKETYVEPKLEENDYCFTVKVGAPPDLDTTRRGTRVGRGANFRCVMSGTPMNAHYIRKEAKCGRLSARLMAIVAEGDRGRVYISPTPEHEEIAKSARPKWKPDLSVPTPCHDVDRLPMYGMPKWGDAFTPRQLVALSTFCDLIADVRKRIQRDAVAAGLPSGGMSLQEGGTSAEAYSDAIIVYLALAVDRMASTLCTIALWSPTRGQTVTAFARQALPMTWDFPDVNPFGGAAGDYTVSVEGVIKGLSVSVEGKGNATQSDAVGQSISVEKVVSTDPPYYDNIGYAVLSDFFYVWLRRSLRKVFPSLFATLAVPKEEELIAAPYRHGSKNKAEAFFLKGMTLAMGRLSGETHPAFPVTIYYAFKQSERKGNGGGARTGWETFLDAVIQSGFAISGTWPIRTERPTGMKAAINALASSIVLVCRRREDNAPTATRREFVDTLRTELPKALRQLQSGNIAPVDLAQAAIGPGMSVFTHYARVLNADGKLMSVREALMLINQTLDEVLAEQDGDLDADTRWALAWFEQSGFAYGEYGVAETLSKAKNTSVSGMVEAGILESRSGKVRLFRPQELHEDWDAEKERRLSVWESTHHLVRILSQSEAAAADIMAKLGSDSELVRDLTYRLYRICDQKGRSQDASIYNSLVQSWPEIARLAQGIARTPRQASLMGDGDTVVKKPNAWIG